MFLGFEGQRWSDLKLSWCGWCSCGSFERMLRREFIFDWSIESFQKLLDQENCEGSVPARVLLDKQTPNIGKFK